MQIFFIFEKSRDGWSERVHLKRIADHFIFTVESVGSIPPETIVKVSIFI